MAGRPVRLLAAVALVAGGVSVAAPARAAGAAGYCPNGNGVTVVVDFQDLGGAVVVRCAPGPQATGLAALENAGFTVTGTVRWGKAFVCRINGKPGVDTEPCVDTPPASAYWSYWHAPTGGAWTYSSQGVLARKPPLGSFEGWSFSSGRDANHAAPPGLAPVRPAPPPPPQPTATPPRPPATTARPAGGTAGTTRPPTTPGTPVGAAPTGEPTTAGAATAPAAADPVPADPAASPAGGRVGLPVGTIAGAALIAVLVAAAAVTAWRRRRHDPGG